MTKANSRWALLGAALLLSGCAATRQREVVRPPPPPPSTGAWNQIHQLPDATKTRILALKPESVTEQDLRELLAQVPAPQVICIHGGIFPIRSGMNSFARFLMGMGYPEASLRNPDNGSYTYGYYDSSERIAGTVAWYYERDGLRPMLVGHSQGGIQAIRVLHKLAGASGTKLAVWNPLSGTEETRCAITDPLTGTRRPVAGLQVCYATAAVAGGLARVLPNQWDMNFNLRSIPDSVDEFTGFQKGLDPFGGDYLGFGSANDYHAMGSARVRNVRLPATSPHWTIPYSQELLAHQDLRQWIQEYRPLEPAGAVAELSSAPKPVTAKMLWAAEIWYNIKKHWVLELHRAIHAQEAPSHGR